MTSKKRVGAKSPITVMGARPQALFLTKAGNMSKEFRTLLASRWTHGFAALLCSVTCVLFTGCGGPQRAAPVDVELAQATLTQVLDHWKSGGAIEDFRKQTPEIIVQEALWSNGKVLQDFRLTGEPRAEDANWFCDVELIFRADNSDSPPAKTVTYAVGTDPVLTVFHSLL